MPGETRRTHLALPEDLVIAVDRLAGRRRRSQFVTEAVEEKLRRVRLLQTAHLAAGSLREMSTPGWETSEAAAAWVRQLREAETETESPSRPGNGN